jgi:hypothetical protein
MNSIEFPDIPLKYLGLSARTSNCLANKGIKKFSELKNLSELELIQIPNMGKKSISEINLFILNFDVNNFFEINNYLLPILMAQDDQILESSSSESNLDSIAVESLLLSKRSLNALKFHDVNTVGQLSLLTEIELLKFANLGMKSLIEISEAIIDLKINPSKLKSNNLFNTNIADALDRIFDDMTEERANCLKKRLFAKYTLQQCGDLMGVSRERVRQIESKLFRKLNLILANGYINEIEEYMKKNTGITGFLQLEEVGPSFTNISKYLYTAANPSVFLDNVFKKNKILKWQKKKNEFYFFSYNSDSLDDLVNSDSIMKFIETNSLNNFNEAIQAYCLINKQSDNFDYIFNKIKKRLSINSTFAVINAVKQLKKTYKKISLNQIIEFIKYNFDKDLKGKERTIINILSEREITHLKLYLISGGNYFFLDKLNLSKNTINLCAEIAIAFMRENPSKNYRTSDVYAKIIKFSSFHQIPTEEQSLINEYVLNAILREQEGYVDNLSYTGRSSWSVKKNIIENNRTEIAPAVEKILLEQGKPMVTEDIKVELLKMRGLSKSFQLHTTLSQNKVIQLSEGLWGLRARDLDVTPAQENLLIELIKQSFKEGKKVLDFFDIQQFKEELNINKDVSVYKLMRMLFRHIPVGRRRTPGKLVFLIKLNRSNPLNFCIYSPDIDDNKIKEIIDSKKLKFFFNGINDDSILVKWKDAKIR